MRPFDPREIDKARSAADQRAAGEDELWDRLPAARTDRSRAVGEALAAEKRIDDQGMGLEALEFIIRRQGRVDVVQMNDKADGDQVVVIVIDEGAAARPAAQRPAECVLHQARLEFCWIDRPYLLQTDTEFLRLAAILQPVAGEDPLGEGASRAFRDERVFAAQLHTAREVRLRISVTANSHIASRNAYHLSFIAEER